MNPIAAQTPVDLPLRDIHLPEPVSWWPPALGWWILAGALLVVALLVLLFLVWYRRGRLDRAARSALAQVFADHRRHGDPQRLLRELSVVLRRIALSYFPRTEVASLSGDAWLDFLDQAVAGTAAPEGFRGGPGRVLAEGPFTPNTQAVDAPALERLCQTWLKGVAKPTEHAKDKSRRGKVKTRSRSGRPSRRIVTLHPLSLRRERDGERVVGMRS